MVSVEKKLRGKRLTFMKKCIFAKEEKKSCKEFSLNQQEIRLKLDQQKRHFETKMKMIQSKSFIGYSLIYLDFSN